MAPAPSPTGLVRRLVAPSWVQPEALNVTPDLIGVPLAPPARRAWAMGVDLVVIALLSSTGSFWIAAAIAGLVFQLRRRWGERSAWRSLWLWGAIALMVFVAAQRATVGVQRWLAPPPQAGAQAGRDVDADVDDDVDTAPVAARSQPAAAAATVASTSFATAASTSISIPIAAAPATGAARATGPTPREAQLAARVSQLEGQLAEARHPRPARWRDDVVRLAHQVGLCFGWAIAYFTLLPFWWNGQTVGKKLFGLRVMLLTGRPLSVVACFGRYGGYAAGMATGASGFAQVLWDSNRQAIQDKIAHTVVIDLRQPRAIVVMDAAPFAADESAEGAA